MRSLTESEIGAGGRKEGLVGYGWQAATNMQVSDVGHDTPEIVLNSPPRPQANSARCWEDLGT